ncbi:peptidylprolyl isomerase [Sneathiella aquimaris]|uniref:peptidylprolyl isomerase n=1 Tax=Sneathiella aquimaris TaxID=2599305 RepID=UPI00146F007B|nr:peptidylprolyl isomerase [Sneathiella aquimaris]
MKIANFLAFLIVAGVSLGIGYYVGSDMQNPLQQFTGDKTAPADKAPDASDMVVATVNGTEIRESEVLAMYETLPEQYRQAPYPFVKPQLVEQMVNMKLVLDAALAEEFQKQPEFMSELSSTRDQILQGYYIRKKIEEMVTDEAVKAEYEKVTQDFVPEQEVHARHILLKEEEEAKAVIEKLDAGGNFVELAKEFSTGPSKTTGGDLGYFVKERMVPEFATAAFALEKGAYTKEPVQTQFGWHVILLEDRRDTQPPAFSEMEPQLRNTLTNNSVTGMLDKMKEGATISIVKPEGETSEDEKKAEPEKEG